MYTYTIDRGSIKRTIIKRTIITRFVTKVTLLLWYALFTVLVRLGTHPTTDPIGRSYAWRAGRTWSGEAIDQPGWKLAVPFVSAVSETGSGHGGIERCSALPKIEDGWRLVESAIRIIERNFKTIIILLRSALY